MISDLYYAVSERVDLPGLGPAVFVLFGHFLPPFPCARDDDPHLALKVPERNRFLAPIADLAVSLGGHDRMERHHAEPAR